MNHYLGLVADEPASRISLSLLSHHWDYKHMPPQIAVLFGFHGVNSGPCTCGEVFYQLSYSKSTNQIKFKIQLFNNNSCILNTWQFLLMTISNSKFRIHPSSLKLLLDYILNLRNWWRVFAVLLYVTLSTLKSSRRQAPVLISKSLWELS